jgi:hypothetical protein
VSRGDTGPSLSTGDARDRTRRALHIMWLVIAVAAAARLLTGSERWGLSTLLASSVIVVAIRRHQRSRSLAR